MEYTCKKRRNDKIVDALLNGDSVKNVAKKLHLSRNSIIAITKRRGYHFHDYSAKGVKFNTYRIIARILNTTDSFSDIARDFSISRQAVSDLSHRLLEVGIKFPKRIKGRRAMSNTIQIGNKDA